MSLDELQRRTRAWHDETFPGAPSAALGLKLAEEAGELAKAVNRIEHTRRPTDDALHTQFVRDAYANLEEEIGDVAICLMTLAARYFAPLGKGIEEIIAQRVEVVTTRPLKADAV